ncbi:MAG: PAS domain S-box protein [Cyanobacteriota bacterium]
MNKSEKQVTDENLLLHLTKPLLKIVLENLPIFVFSVNKKGVFIFSDGKALSSIAINPNELIGLSIFDFYKDIPEIINSINNALLGKTCKVNITLKGISFDSNISPIFDAEQNIIGATGLFTEISSQNNTEIFLQQKNEELQIAKEKAEKNEQNYKLLYEFNTMPMSIFDSNTLKFLSVNNAFSDKYGYSKDEFLSMSIFDIRATEEIERIKNTKTLSENGLKNLGLGKHKKKNGEIFHVEVIRDSIIFEGKDAKLLIVNDVTEKVIAEEKYKRNNQLLEESQFFANLGGWEFDLITKELYWTAQTYRIHDTSPEEFNPTLDAGLSFYLPESKKLLVDALEIAITQGKGYDLYLEKYTTKGRKIDVRTTCKVTISDGKSIKLTGVFQDITEQKKIERKLTEIETNRKFNYYFRNLIESIKDPLLTLDVDGKITDVNSATENATGLLRNSLIGTYFSDYFTEPEKAKIAYREVFEQNLVKDFPLTIRHISNKFIHVLYNSSLYRNEQGEILGVFAAARDITERKEAEKRSKLYLDELILANKDLKQFAYVSSHELQSPLRTVSNYIHLFKEDYFSALDDKGLKYLNIIDNATKRMSLLLNSLLGFSQLGRNSKLANVDIRKLISDVLIDLDSLIKTSQAIIEVSDMPKIRVYKLEMRQLFQNLITNAIKFQKKNSIPKIQITSKNIDDKWVFSIKDNGIGIDSNHFARIFDIFQRLHVNEDEYKGSGIGLAYCKKIVNIHQGEIWIESSLGNGSTFYFSIPNKDILNAN